MLFYKTVEGRRVYTLSPEGSICAEPAKYSPEDKYSHERATLKIRHGIFPFQKIEQE